ncbi:hypothetical protein C0989_007212, partial [Termitomyces sp. Mn162]
MSQNPSLFLLPVEDRFDGSNWVVFRTTVTKAARGCGLLGYLTSEIREPEPETYDPGESKGAPIKASHTSTWWGSASPSLDEWLQRDAYARSMVTLNVVNPVGAGVRMDGTAADAWNSLTSLHDAKTDLGLLHAEEELSSIKYTD